MRLDFWSQRWDEGRTGFHRPVPNDGLERFGAKAFGAPSGRILVPLCGQTLDLDWLVAQGFEVVGVEFVPAAVRGLQSRWGSPDEVFDSPCGLFSAFRWAKGLTVYQGDFFSLPSLHLEPFDGIWDRAAIVALSPDRREEYAAILVSSLKPGGTLLLRSFAYDQNEMSGPPFSVDTQTVASLFPGTRLHVLENERITDDPKMKGRGLSWQKIITMTIEF